MAAIAPGASRRQHGAALWNGHFKGVKAASQHGVRTDDGSQLSYVSHS